MIDFSGLPDKKDNFQDWYANHAQKLGLNPNPDDPRHHYDYRAAYKVGAMPDKTGHWPSKFKTEGHPRMIVDGVNTKTGEKQIDFSGLPDKAKEIDMSGLPDRPTAQTILGSEPTGGTWGAVIKAGIKVPLAVAGQMAAYPGAGIEALGRLIKTRSLKEATKGLEKRLGVFPETLITTPEEVESMELIEKYGMWPIRMAGKGWELIGKETGIPYAEPIGATIGEAAAMGAIGGESIRLLKMRGKATMRGLSAKNIEKLRMAQESKHGRYGIVPEEGLLIEGIPAKAIPIPQIPKAESQGLKVMELIGKRRAEIDKGILDSEIFIKQFERDFAPIELEAVPFIRQGIKDPNILKEIGKENIIPVIKKPSPELLKATEKIGRYYDESFKFLQENWGDIGFVENYVTQIWDIPKGRKSEVVNYFVTRNPFLKKRVIPTLEEGIKLGLKPKTTNIAELLRIYDQYKIKTVHNLNFAKGLKDLVGVDGEPLMMRSDKAPVDWITIDHPAMNRAMAIGKIGEEGILLTKVPVKVHPEIAKEVKIIFDKPFSHGAIHALETVNAFAKKGMLSLSFFHHHALTESAFSTGIGRKALKQWNPYKIYKALKTKDYEIFRHQELAKDGIDHGLTFGALSDVQRNRVANSLQSLERVARGTPGAKQLTKGMRKANELWDSALWDYYHNSLKFWAYEKNIFDAFKFSKKKLGRDLLPNEITEIKKTMASFVNDSFGGQNWELNRVLGNPKVRQMLHWALLAPDWTFSVLKQAAAPAKGLYLQAKARNAPTAEAYIQQKLAGKTLTRQGTKFWAKTALYFNLIAQSVNYGMTKKEYGEGRFTWENPESHYLNIFIGRNKDGTEKYLRMGKQFREVLEWGMNPIRKVGAKLSPGLREAMRQVTAHDPGSGYPAEWAEKEGLATIPERALSILEMPIPFSLRPYVKSRPGVFMFTFPTSKGMTPYKTVEIFKKALKDGDIKRVRKTFIDALQSNLNAERHLKTAQSLIKSDITYGNKGLANDILLEMNELDPEAQEDALLLYKQKGILTPEVYKQYILLKENQLEVKKQKLMLGIK
ncbi:MAG: hypothetical protein KAX30_04330 [Candidatus Atribacteria bacterium]|nr:hypothetical protein [Candidatus Atribacteria bacterium]